MPDNAASHEAFFALRHGLPRQGPGSDATTRHLLSLAGPLPQRPRALDLGCGPGRAALVLAEAGADVTAVDLHEPFLNELNAAAEARGLVRSITALTRAARAAGYDVLGVYSQPESDWEEYYGPLAERVDSADLSMPGMAEALAVTREEIAMRRDHRTEYGYTGYVLRPVT